MAFMETITTPTLAPTRRRQGVRLSVDAWIVVGLVAMTLATFVPVLGCGFLNVDDSTYVINDLAVQRGICWQTIYAEFTSRALRLYHPLTPITFALIHSFFGNHPKAYHSFNVLAHACNVAMVFGLLKMLTGCRWRSMAAAGVFAVHPMRLESVVWVAELKDVMSVLFGLAAMIAYVAYVRSEKGGCYVASAGLFVVSLLYKPMLVTLPALLMLLDVYPLKRLACGRRAWRGDAAGRDDVGTDAAGINPTAGEPDAGGVNASGGNAVGANATGASASGANACWANASRAGGAGEARARPIGFLLLEKAPFILAVLAIVGLVWSVPDRAAPVAFVKFPLSVRLENAVVSYFLYVYNLFDLSHLGRLYPIVQRSTAEVAGAGAFLIGVTVFAVMNWRRRPLILVGWLWFVGTLLPVSGIVQVYWQAMATHYSYFPSIGLLTAIVWALPDAVWSKKRRRLRFAAMATLAAILCAVSFRHITAWHDSMSFWDDATAATDGTLWVTHVYRGFALNHLGRLEEAKEEFLRAVQLDEPMAETQMAYSQLGYIDNKLRQPDEAIYFFDKAIADCPTAATSYCGKADALAEKGDLPGAIAEYQNAIRVDPIDGGTYLSYGVMLSHHDRLDEAIDKLRKSIAIDPESYLPHYALGTVLAARGDLRGALAEHRLAVQLRPENPDIHDELASDLVRLGRYDEAIGHFQIASSAGRRPSARWVCQYADALLHENRPADALEQAKLAAAMSPDYAGAYFYQGSALRELGDGQGAAAALRQAKLLDPKYPGIDAALAGMTGQGRSAAER
jgi:tetratricopeptide (TPR) repeat protein